MSYQLRQAMAAFRGNLTAGVATLSTMTLTLTLLALVALVTINLETTVRGLEKDVQITAFLAPTENPTLGQAQGDAVIASLSNIAGIESSQFISKAEAFEKLKSEYTALEGANKLIENPLTDRIVIRVQNPRTIEEIVQQVKQITGVSDLEYGADFINTVLSTLETVRNVGYALVLLLVFNTLLNILNTIRIAMFARRDEIEVMRLIGATRGFIRTPYVIEGLGLAFLASGLTAAIIVPTYSMIATRVAELVPFIPIVRDTTLVFQVLGIITLLGLALGLLGSIWAANRYLREAE
ncbi:MAG: permease-like cell division protein FtsX [Deinococcales bacterium]